MNSESFSTLLIEYNSTDDLFTTFESREWKTWEISHIVQNIHSSFYPVHADSGEHIFASIFKISLSIFISLELIYYYLLLQIWHF